MTAQRTSTFHRAENDVASTDDSEAGESLVHRNALRYRGIIIAASATLVLWAVVALTLWGALALFR